MEYLLEKRQKLIDRTKLITDLENQKQEQVKQEKVKMETQNKKPVKEKKKQVGEQVEEDYAFIEE